MMDENQREERNGENQTKSSWFIALIIAASKHKSKQANQNLSKSLIKKKSSFKITKTTLEEIGTTSLTLLRTWDASELSQSWHRWRHHPWRCWNSIGNDGRNSLEVVEEEKERRKNKRGEIRNKRQRNLLSLFGFGQLAKRAVFWSSGREEKKKRK